MILLMSSEPNILNCLLKEFNSIKLLKQKGRTMFKLIIFDLDGTLINSIEDLADAVNYGLEKMGYKPHPLEKFYRFIGNGALKLCQRALADYTDSEEAVNTLHEYFSGYYRAHSTDKTVTYDGIKELVNELRAKGLKLAVASNKPDEFTKSIVTDIFGNDTFSVILGKRENCATKPAPQIIYDIMNEAGVIFSDTILAGDSDVDILTARNAGIKSIGCTWGFRTKEELISTGADYIADHASDILGILF